MELPDSFTAVIEWKKFSGAPPPVSLSIESEGAHHSLKLKSKVKFTKCVGSSLVKFTVFSLGTEIASCTQEMRTLIQEKLNDSTDKWIILKSNTKKLIKMKLSFTCLQRKVKKQFSAAKGTAERLLQESSGQVRISLKNDSFPIEGTPDIGTMSVRDIIEMPVALTKAVIRVMIDRIKHLSAVTRDLPRLKAELNGKLEEKGNLRTDSDALLNTLTTTVNENNEKMKKLLTANKELKQATCTQKELLCRDECELAELTGKIKGLTADSQAPKPILQRSCSELDRKLQELCSKNSAIQQEATTFLLELQQKPPGPRTPSYNSLYQVYSTEYQSLHKTLTSLSHVLSTTDSAVTCHTSAWISLKRDFSYALEQEEGSLHETDHLLCELDRETLYSDTLLLSYEAQQEVLRDQGNFIQEASECRRARTVHKDCALDTLGRAAGLLLSESERTHSQYCALVGALDLKE